MSRAYRAYIRVAEYNKALEDMIIEAISNEAQAFFNSGDFYIGNKELTVCGESYLYGGESEEEFSERLAEAIWKSNKRYCPIECEMTFLEIDGNGYYFDKDLYRIIMNEPAEELTE